MAAPEEHLALLRLALAARRLATLVSDVVLVMNEHHLADHCGDVTDQRRVDKLLVDLDDARAKVLEVIGPPGSQRFSSPHDAPITCPHPADAGSELAGGQTVSARPGDRWPPA